jgi:hypothetical protein
MEGNNMSKKIDREVYNNLPPLTKSLLGNAITRRSPIHTLHTIPFNAIGGVRTPKLTKRQRMDLNFDRAQAELRAMTGAY